METTICATPLLATRDGQMAQLYALVRTDALGAGPSAQAEEQAKWLADREQQCTQKALTEIVACIRQEYDARLIDLADSALIRAPDLSLAVLRQEIPEQAPLYEAIWRMTTMPAGPARTSAVAALIGPMFVKERAERATMLGPIRTARDAAANVKNFATFIDLMGAVQALPLSPPAMPCEAIVRQPALIHALDAMFGSSMDNALSGSDCAEMLPPPPQFAALASDANTAAMAGPDCTGTLRFAGLRSYGESLIATQLNREGTPQAPDAETARKSAAWQAAHAAELASAAGDLAAYYASELHLANAAAPAERAVRGVVDGAFEVCADD